MAMAEEMDEIDESRLEANSPDLAKFGLLKKLRDEHPDNIMCRVDLVPGKSRDPDRAPLKAKSSWSVKGRTEKERQAFDSYVRHELKKRLGLDEPSSIVVEETF